jgi:hypothetical protein
MILTQDGAKIKKIATWEEQADYDFEIAAERRFRRHGDEQDAC